MLCRFMQLAIWQKLWCLCRSGVAAASTPSHAGNARKSCHADAGRLRHTQRRDAVVTIAKAGRLRHTKRRDASATPSGGTPSLHREGGTPPPHQAAGRLYHIMPVGQYNHNRLQVNGVSVASGKMNLINSARRGATILLKGDANHVSDILCQRPCVIV